MVPLSTTGVAATANSGGSMSKNRAAVMRMCLGSLEKDLGEAGLGGCLSARCLDPQASRQCDQGRRFGDNASSEAMPGGRASTWGPPSSSTQAISPQSRALKGVSGVMRFAESTPVNHT